jgi:hypothetical protein
MFSPSPLASIIFIASALRPDRRHNRKRPCAP